MVSYEKCGVKFFKELVFTEPGDLWKRRVLVGFQGLWKRSSMEITILARFPAHNAREI
jgi:hypothetical protein